jgi:putative ABC transport system permease protein
MIRFTSHPALRERFTKRRRTMFKNYLKIALRNLHKFKGYSLINIAGLAIGMACCIFILLYIQHELSYDKFHAKANEIYRIALHGKIGDSPIDWATTTAQVGPLMIDEFPEVLDAVRFKYPDKNVFSYEDKRFFEFAPLYVDNSFFNIFSFRLIKGDAKTALNAPFSLVMTQVIAEKYFGNEDPIGKIVTVNNSEKFQVTGIIEKPPSNSHFTFDILASFETLYRTAPQEVDGWIYWAYQTYLLLQPGTNYQELEAKFNGFVEKHIGEMLRQIGAEHTWYLQPLTSIHLHSHLSCELAANSDIRYIYAFAAIALFILLIACMNFMNLSTARSANRAKEVGIRKVLGSIRSKLILQFLSESLILAIASLVVALFIVWLVLSYFKSLIGFDIQIHKFAIPWLLTGSCCITFLVGVVSGSYPAFYLSRFLPVKVLKGDFSKNSRNSWFRSLLVMSQFTISIGLIIGTIVIYNQLNYMRTKKLGFQKEQMLVLSLRDDDTKGRAVAIKSELLKVEGVVGVCGSDMVPGEYEYGIITCYPESLSHGHGFKIENLSVDSDFLDTYGIDIVVGRGFSKEMITDQYDAALINETAWRALGWKNPIGKRISDHINPAKLRIRTIIGVVKDFHHKILHEPIEPTLIDYSPNFSRRLSLKLSTVNTIRTVKLVEQKWHEIAPNHPFDYFFLDDFYDDLYRNEARLGSIFQLFTMLAIFIGCLGLFGLASFTAEQRTKEIGIRKVLGASLAGIVHLMNKDFVKWILISNLIAWPVAYYAMNKWLQNFAYRVNIGIWIFILSAFLALIVALITVSYQSIKAALANPVESLRYE